MYIDEVQKILVQIIENEFGDKGEVTYTEETDLIEDLDFDSLDIFRLISAVEEKFHIQFNDVDLLAENFVRLGDFCNLIMRQGEKNVLE